MRIRLDRHGPVVWIGLLSIALLAGCGGSQTRRATGDVQLRGTEMYHAKVQQLYLSPQDARRQLVAWRRAQAEQDQGVLVSGDLIAVGYHDIIVDDCYVFSPPDYLGIPLAGYYVNGNTGHVQYRESSVRIPPHEAKRRWGLAPRGHRPRLWEPGPP